MRMRMIRRKPASPDRGRFLSSLPRPADGFAGHPDIHEPRPLECPDVSVNIRLPGGFANGEGKDMGGGENVG